MYYDDYEEYDYINESALDIAIDMSDRYGFAISDAYVFATEALNNVQKTSLDLARNVARNADRSGREFSRKINEQNQKFSRTSAAINAQRRQLSDNNRRLSDKSDFDALNKYINSI